MNRRSFFGLLPSSLGLAGQREDNELASLRSENANLREQLANKKEPGWNWAFDPVAMFKASGRMPDSWQARMIESRHPRILINGCRQCGKTTVLAFKALHRACFGKSLIFVGAPSKRAAADLLLNMLDLHLWCQRSSGGKLPPVVERLVDDKGLLRALEFGNNSMVMRVVTHGDARVCRGWNWGNKRLIVIDDAAYVADSLCRLLHANAWNGDIIAASTPHYARGWFWKHFEGSRRFHWSHQSVRATRVKAIPKEFLDEERATLGEPWFNQEYMCEFLPPEMMSDDPIVAARCRLEIHTIVRNIMEAGT